MLDNDIHNNHHHIRLLRTFGRRIKSSIDPMICKILAVLPVSQKHKTLAIIRVDGIGDYILFRNFISLLKKCPHYRDFGIFFIGNMAWKDLSLFLDGNHFSKSLWINKKHFLRNPFYRYYIFLKLRFLAVEVAINPTYSRDFVDDAIMQAVNAGRKIGYQGDAANMNEEQLIKGASIYSEFIIPPADAHIFEFYRNRFFFSRFLNRQLNISKPSLAIESEVSGSRLIHNERKKYVVIFPGAGQSYKIWNYESYGEIIQHIVEKYSHHQIYLAGSRLDAKHVTSILKCISIPQDRIKDVTGELNLVDLMDLLSHASLYIGSDTGAAHMSACCGVPVIAFFTGHHFGRFAPYPDDFHYTFISLYPPAVNMNLSGELKESFRYSSPYSIRDILPETVIQKIEMILS